ncbi:hypothetical protein CBER1_02523 [Cercospora berteroae]|uniref:Uncharacterized protein n=1 Tax=Cercospora berteroae TaxID=357750 RepID=A0A2S6C415_9PEZI|nr:hypothetical protein CBER1_02523 [Cercospora berteroae]
MAPTHPVVSPEAPLYPREHLDHEGDLQPTSTPANTVTSLRPFDTDSGSEYSEPDAACEDQDLPLPTRQARSSSTPASGPRKGILQSPRPRSPSAGDSSTGLELPTVLAASTSNEDADEDDDYAHQRWTIEDFYDPNRGHVKEAAQNGSEFDGDDNGAEASQASNDEASVYSDVDRVPDLDDSVEIPAWRRPVSEGTASLEVCTSDETHSAEHASDQHDDASTQPDTDPDNSLSRDPSVPRLQFLGLRDEQDFEPQDRMYTMPSITEESLRTYESNVGTYPVPNPWQGEESFPAYQEPEGLSATGMTELGLERVPSETRSAPAPVNRRGRRMTKTEQPPRHSSLTEVHRMKERVRRPSFVSTKASPARPAMATVSVKAAESPRLNPVYNHPGARYLPLHHNNEPVRTVQTINSDLGTYKMMWEDEPSPGSGGSTGTMLGQPSCEEHLLPTDSPGDGRLVAPTPMLEKVRSRLTAWTWERQQSPENNAGWLPLLDTAGQRRAMTSDHSDSHELPPGPPNTALHSGEPSRPHSSGKFPMEEDGSEQPIEIRSRGVIAARPKLHTAHQTRAPSPMNEDSLAPPRRNSLPASPTIPRQLSNLALEDLRFKSHRDSVEITRGHIWIEGLEHRSRERPNSLLLASRDSFKLAKNRMDAPWPRATASETHAVFKPAGSSIQWSRFGGLSPIPDRSPPNASSGSFELPSTESSMQSSSSNAQHHDSADFSPRKVPDQKDAAEAHPQVVGNLELQKRLGRLEQRVRVLENKSAIGQRK